MNRPFAERRYSAEVPAAWVEIVLAACASDSSGLGRRDDDPSRSPVSDLNSAVRAAAHERVSHR